MHLLAHLQTNPIVSKMQFNIDTIFIANSLYPTFLIFAPKYRNR